MQIHRTFTFDAAHRLTGVPPEHKCARLHGHSFRVEVHLKGPVGPSGWVMDFGDLAGVAGAVVAELDHTYLNEVPGLENPTSENIARWLWERLAPELPLLSAVVVRESDHAGVAYRGGDAPGTPTNG